MNWIADFFKSNAIQEINDAEKLLDHHHISYPLGAHKYLREIGVLPQELSFSNIADHGEEPIISSVLQWEVNEIRKKKHLVLFVQLHTYKNYSLLVCNDARGTVYWNTLPSSWNDKTIWIVLENLQRHLNKKLALVGHKEIILILKKIPATDYLQILLLAYPSLKKLEAKQAFAITKSKTPLPPHLQQLEEESIYIFREAVAEAENPVMLYSIGKDSTVMLHLAYKAFYPAPPPFALLHVDTRWKFQEMYAFRDAVAEYYKIRLLVHTNPEAIAKNINPFDHGASLHTDITKTQGLKQALEQHQFDMVFGGARRDEEKSRAKERVFSFRTADHQWDPKNQRPELWNIYNTQKLSGESIRVFPLSNWTEIDVWQYIVHENIPVVPLYFAKPRPVIERNGMLLLVDDDRFPVRADEKIQLKPIRFRTLGCYPLTGAVESHAQSLEEILAELQASRYSERQGRAIDHDSSASMEKKKKEGYF